MLSRTEWIEGISAMDDDRFVASITPHLPDVVRVAAALVGAADAEDAVQEACIRAWQGWPELRDHDAVRAWLLRITVNVCHNWLGGRFGTRRRHAALLDDAALQALALPGSDPGDSDHAGWLDVQRALTRLEPEQRTVVVLRYLVGLDASEIGAALNLPSATIRTRLRRGLLRLRELLQAPLSDSLALLERNS
jgi:RNA polymerase sigma factor (sigma-70 family)